MEGDKLNGWRERRGKGNRRGEGKRDRYGMKLSWRAVMVGRMEQTADQHRAEKIQSKLESSQCLKSLLWLLLLFPLKFPAGFSLKLSPSPPGWGGSITFILVSPEWPSCGIGYLIK